MPIFHLLSFLVANIYLSAKIAGKCPYYGFDLVADFRSPQSAVDSHVIHQMTTLVGFVTEPTKPVCRFLPLRSTQSTYARCQEDPESYNYDALALDLESSSSNFLRHNYDKTALLAAHQADSITGLALLEKHHSSIMQEFYKDPVFQQRSSNILQHAQFGLNPITLFNNENSLPEVSTLIAC